MRANCTPKWCLCKACSYGELICKNTVSHPTLRECVADYRQNQVLWLICTHNILYHDFYLINCASTSEYKTLVHTLGVNRIVVDLYGPGPTVWHACDIRINCKFNCNKVKGYHLHVLSSSLHIQ